MSTGDEKCGQVRGPIQLTFARSQDPIVSLEHSITRMAVTTEREAESQHGDNRTMGRKHTVPYGLYRAHGFISAALAEQTGFSDDDLALFWEALQNMFEHDHSAARGQMNTRGLYVFRHESRLGNAPSHQLLDAIVVKPRDASKPSREVGDYEVTIQRDRIRTALNSSRKSPSRNLPGPKPMSFAESDDPVAISALQHYRYCPRQYALIHLEQEFLDNLHTQRGQLAHQRVDDPGEQWSAARACCGRCRCTRIAMGWSARLIWWNCTRMDDCFRWSTNTANIAASGMIIFSLRRRRCVWRK